MVLHLAYDEEQDHLKRQTLNHLLKDLCREHHDILDTPLHLLTDHAEVLRQTLKRFWQSQASPLMNSSPEDSETSPQTDFLMTPGLMPTTTGLLRKECRMAAAESTSDTQRVTLPS